MNCESHLHKLKTKFFLIGILLFSICVHAQLPDTDIFLCSIKKENGKYIFSKPENITNRKGYDNQPCFTPDGKRILYVSVIDTNQSDVYYYDLNLKVSKQFTDTKESEYSPAYTKDNKYISVVRVDADSGQRFYKLPLDNPKNARLINNTDSIGYACWLDEINLAMFILGPANTLQILNTQTSQRKLIASDIGRCMKLSPDGSKMYFVLKSNPAEWFIYSMNCKDFILTRIIATPPHCEDFAIMPDGSLLMGREGQLFISENNSNWSMIANFSNEMQDFYRIALNADGTRMAVVAFSGKRP
jgi:Tol biopolymer transport system component